MPNFVGILFEVGGNLFKSASLESKTGSSNMPLLSIQNTMKVIAETSIVPITILTGVMTVTQGLLHLATLILKRIPK